MAKLVANVYADGLRMAAADAGVTMEVYEEAKAICGILKENAGFCALLKEPRVAREEKLSIIRAVFDGRVSSQLMGLIDVMTKKGRQGELYAVLSQFMSDVRRDAGIGEVDVRSAVALSPDQKKRLEEKLLSTSGLKKLEVEYTVDESLLGGIVVRIGDRVADASIKNRMNRLRAGTI